MAFAPFDLSGRVALITGGNGGYRPRHGRGHRGSRRRRLHLGHQRGQERRGPRKPRGHGTRVSAKVCNVADEAAVDRCFAETVESSAASTAASPTPASAGATAAFDDMTTEEWNRIMAVNLDGVFWTFRAAARHMRERAEAGDPFGRLVGTASLAAISGQARGEHYAATKGGLVSMIKALAVEYARYGVTAHTILPGWIETDMTQGAFSNEKFEANVLKRVLSRRWGQPEDFAGIAVYIMSTASSYHSAETFLIDGGYFVF